MGETTEIAWTDHTFNPWIGCTKVSPGCTNCYAEALDRRWGRSRWGKGAKRERTSAVNWKLPLRWNAAAEKAGKRARVFCASLADVFDAEAPEQWRFDLFSLIEKTPHLDWQVLTKRPELAVEFFGGTSGAGLSAEPLPNLWLGVTCEDQQRANERIPPLLQLPAAVRFLSCEPQLEPIDLSPWLIEWNRGVMHSRAQPTHTLVPTDEEGRQSMATDCLDCDFTTKAGIDWVIVGGESGGKARPFDLAWARSLRDQCKAAGVAYFFKQAGSRPTETLPTLTAQSHSKYLADGGNPFILDTNKLPTEAFEWRLNDRKGGDPTEWPADLRVREFPRQGD